MRKIAFSSFLLFSAWAAFGQQAPALSDQAPPATDQALRARVDKFYAAFVSGKYKEAYLMVADDSQDKFFELSKDQYKGCEIIRINYTENFTQATVVTSCKRDWRFHGSVTPITFPLTSTWEVLDGQWYWHFVKPTMMATPFSATGFVPVPPDAAASNAGPLPQDIAGAAKSILSKIGIDKSSVRLLSNQRSQEVVHLRNDMPGEVLVKVDPPNIPGLTISVGQPKLQANEQTTILFEWNPTPPITPVAIRQTVQVRIDPTAQVFPINLVIESQNGPTTPNSSAPQK
jgi:hypothetical protein